ncbi:MAG: hypothetical protein K8S55_16155 [Phycisphaerae bacterium]|nr:hypothetical protein [Phycisphaerae bacterium]
MNQQQHDAQNRPIMSRYQMTHRGQNTTLMLTIVAVILGVACAILIVVTLWAVESKSTMATKLAKAETDYDKSQANVKEVMGKIMEFKKANDKLLQRQSDATRSAGSVAPTVAATDDADTDKESDDSRDNDSHNEEDYKQRCKILEAELSQLQLMNTRCMELLSPKQRKEIQSLAPVSIGRINVKNKTKYIRVRFTVTNNTNRLAEGISGYIRFWNQTEKVAEKSFKIEALEAKESKRKTLKFPTVAYTKYSGYVKMGRD